jgi:pSer/pThr/pTyr-binding forkhead associated (FHA) protein
LEPKKLLLCHSEGWIMEIADGDVLGRTSGNHTDRLGSIPVISGTHAKITFENGAWHITDQRSTNKTYVGGIMAQPGVPVKLQNNDVVQLANVKFTVRET